MRVPTGHDPLAAGGRSAIHDRYVPSVRIGAMQLRTATQYLSLVVLIAVSLGQGGCSDVALDLKPPPRQSVRPAPQPIGRPAPPARQAEPAKVNPEATATAEPQSTFFQLVLVSEPAPSDAPERLRYVRVSRAPARAVGELLAWLYVPSGPTGTETRYTLVYPTSEEGEAAAGHVSSLDVPPVASQPENLPDEPQTSLTLGIGLIHAAPLHGPASRERLKHAQAALARAAAGTALPEAQRWAAAMVAGGLAADCLYDFKSADSHYALAETLATPGSLEQMSALYARACAHVRAGRTEPARQILTQLIGHFGPLRVTEPFGRARKLLSQLGHSP
ncbi:MAG: hypothetical protein AMXMBFR13_34070 [Phycisphaerae bacterium]